MSSKCGVFHQSYKSERFLIFETWFARGWMALLFAWMLVFPFVAKPIGKALGTHALYLANLIGIYIIGVQGLNLLTGYTGQISLGHGAFMGVGAYASAILTMKSGRAVRLCAAALRSASPPSSGCSSGSPRCASRASTWRSRRWPRSSSSST